MLIAYEVHRGLRSVSPAVDPPVSDHSGDMPRYAIPLTRTQALRALGLYGTGRLAVVWIGRLAIRRTGVLMFA